MSRDDDGEISKKTVLEAGISILPGKEVHVSEMQPELRRSFRRLV